MGFEMDHPSGHTPADSKVEQAPTGEVQYLLVGSLVGTILLMITYAIFAYAVR
jgi:hypothetical protein